MAEEWERVEAVRAGVVGCYLNRKQMTALLQEAKELGVSRNQIIKEVVVQMLVDVERLPESEIESVRLKQDDLRANPHPNLKEPEDLRVGRLKPEERPHRRRRRMAL